MTKIYHYLKLIPILLLACTFSATAQVKTFSYTGAVQTYTVPAGVTTITFDAMGASGGDFSYGAGIVGLGAQVTGTMNVTPGQILTIYVGGQGNPGSYYFGATGGFNGGGNTTNRGGSGGGASDIRTGGVTLADRIVVAGGGGGTGFTSCYGSAAEKGGDGGGLTGENGWDNSAPYTLAPGGDQTGLSGGALGIGGDAGFLLDGGGAGGGYYGGLGGTNTTCIPYYYGGRDASGGGGGSSYTDPSITAFSHTRGVRTGNGVVVLCAPGIAGTIITDTVCVGSTVTFIDTTGTPGGVWSSSNTGIATVDPVTGKVTGVAPGGVFITRDVILPCGNASVSVLITVYDVPAPITGTFGFCLGSTSTLSSSPSGGTWTSSNTANATVPPSVGDVFGLGVGTSIISYKLSTGCAATATVVVKPLPSAIVGPIDACVGVSTTYSDATPFGVWTVSNSNASIDPVTGVLTGVTAGATMITYAVGGCYVTLNVTIHDPATAIVGTNNICVGDNTSLLVFGYGGTWSSSHPPIATVDAIGTVTGVSIGNDTISYNIPGCPATIFPMVISGVTPIIGSTSACVGIAVTLSDATPGGVWSSSSTTTVVSPSGVVTTTDPVGATATITYSIPAGCYVTHNLVVNNPPGTITGKDSVCQGATTKLRNDTTGGIWSSTNLFIAQIEDTTGLVKGISTGTVNISYTLTNGCFATKTFFVEPPVTPMINITRSPSASRLCQFTDVTFTLSPTDAGPTPFFTWTKFGVPLGSGFGTSFTYRPIHGDVITVSMLASGVCTLSDTATDSLTFDIDSIRSPIIRITNSSSPDTIQYLGQVINMYASVSYEGDAPVFQWFKNGKSISGANDRNYSTAVYENDTFYCEVTSNYQCLEGSPKAQSNKIYIYNRLAVPKVSTAGNFSLFPNPNNGTLTLTGKVNISANNAVTIDVTDMLGHNVYSTKATTKNGQLNEQITLNNVANGTYLLHVNTAAGSEVFHFVINK